MFQEWVVLPDGGVFELKFLEEMHYRLRFTKHREVLVEYRGDGKKHSRRAGGREGAYVFKSVEQLRYDFERDAENAQRPG